MIESATSPQEPERVAQIQRLGRWLILAGVLVWGVWLAVKLLGGEPQVEFFLPVHLSGVIPGSIMSRWGAVKRWLTRRR